MPLDSSLATTPSTRMILEHLTTDALSISLEEEIGRFIDSQNTGHPFQFPRWSGVDNHFLLGRQNGAICWFANVGTHFPLGGRFATFRAATVNRGPVCDDPEQWRNGLEELAQWTREAGFLHADVIPERVRLGASSPSDLSGWTPFGAKRISLRRDVTRSNDELLAGMRKNTRYEIRRAERAGAVVETAAAPAETESFLELYRETGARKGFAADSPDHVRRTIAWLLQEPMRGALLLVNYQRRVLGGAVVVRCGRRCWYVWGANRRHDGLSAGHLAQWHALRWARDHECDEYDFGGYTPGASSGPAFFKEGFGGEVVHLVPARRCVLQARRYRLVQLVSKWR